ncbi:MAG: bifunctional metallophosphatase/5'-nucleotidase, partial [Paludibacteraceae bacterium]|nr:bifunctional metallophosphatase/5'-nucleotidase [Paludibacteraceae bacterium]
MKQYIYALIITLLSLVACTPTTRQPLQIIFTNDSHSQVEPLKGNGGFEARAAIIDSLRLSNPNTLLLDAGDMWQGTPY